MTGELWNKPPKYILQALEQTKLSLRSGASELRHCLSRMLGEFKVTRLDDMTKGSMVSAGICPFSA